MYSVPVAGARWHAVGAPLDRLVRPQCAAALGSEALRLVKLLRHCPPQRAQHKQRRCWRSGGWPDKYSYAARLPLLLGETDGGNVPVF